MAKQFICTQDFPVVTTTAGKLRGFLFDGIFTFHGIRYAKASRFLPPQPVKPWDGIRDAHSYGFICPLLTNPKPAGEVTLPHRFWPENENCQYLNVWTKTLDAKAKQPVMVWFHGGGFASGSSIEHVAYEGDQMAQHGDVVLVSVNHRLNVFGHLDLSMFGEKYANSVNAGIADLVAALEWVRDNIAAFGGDPDNVTIFGQSGGGGKVTTLGQTPAAAGLFHKAIVMSGVLSDDLMGSNVDPKEFVLDILKELHLTEADVEMLEKVPTQALINAVNRVEKAYLPLGKRISWCPKANDWYLGDPLKVGFTDYFQKVPTMVGTVMAEFDMARPVPNKDALTAAEREAIVAEMYGAEHAAELISLFKEAYPEKNEIDVCHLDTVFRPITLEYTKKKAATSAAPVYLYLFTTEFSFDEGKLAWHCADIPFAFHNTARVPVTQMDGVTEKLEEQVFSAYIHFAKYGNPGNEHLPEWKPCTGEELHSMILDRTCVLRTNAEEELLAAVMAHAPAFVFDPAAFGADDDDEDGGAWFY